jgi:hypothetical protein
MRPRASSTSEDRLDRRTNKIEIHRNEAINWFVAEVHTPARKPLMLRFAIIVALAFIVPSVCGGAEPVSRQEPNVDSRQERSVEKFLNGTDADRDAMLKEVVRVISEGGYRDVSMVPWFVMVAKNTKGTEVMLLVDPVTLMTLELESGDEQNAAASELAVPQLRR